MRIVHEILDTKVEQSLNVLLGIKPGHFTEAILEKAIKSTKNRNTGVLENISPEVWNSQDFIEIIFRVYKVTYNQDVIERCTESRILSFQNGRDLGTAKIYRGITLTSIATIFFN